jgi:translation elongation factor EF-Tu-like GTPase
MATPGDSLNITLKLEFPMPIRKGDKFAFRDGGKTIAAGIILRYYRIQQKTPKRKRNK